MEQRAARNWIRCKRIVTAIRMHISANPPIIIATVQRRAASRELDRRRRDYEVFQRARRPTSDRISGLSRGRDGNFAEQTSITIYNGTRGRDIG